MISLKQLEAKKVINIVRALSRKYGGAIATDSINGVRLKIYSATETKIPIYGTPGRLVMLSGAKVYAVCKDGAIRLDDFNFEKKTETKIKELMFD